MSRESRERSSTELTLFSVMFEIFGYVKNVEFADCTKKHADSLKVVGWCMDSNEGTIKGEIQGTRLQLMAMKNWLRHKGSPESRVEDAVFGEMEIILNRQYELFEIREPTSKKFDFDLP